MIRLETGLSDISVGGLLQPRVALPSGGLTAIRGTFAMRILGDPLPVGIGLRVLELVSERLLDLRSEVVLDTFRRIVEVIVGQFEVLLQIALPKPVGSDQTLCRPPTGVGQSISGCARRNVTVGTKLPEGQIAPNAADA